MSEACDNFDLTISTKKTEVVHQPAPGMPYSEPAITVNGKLLKNPPFCEALSPEQYTLMMRLLPKTTKASVAFGRLRTNVLGGMESDLTLS